MMTMKLNCGQTLLSGKVVVIGLPRSGDAAVRVEWSIDQADLQIPGESNPYLDATFLLKLIEAAQTLAVLVASPPWRGHRMVAVWPSGGRED
jgi:hypothetical protein